MFAASKTAGAAAATAANYIEDVFSTYLYTGNGSTQTITNGIDLAGEGGLVWIKNRTGAISHALIDTARGGSQVLSSDTTSAQANYSPQGISAFNSSGFTVNGAATTINSSSYTYASWTFRKQPKFFDVVTYTGTGSVQNIAHNLGSVPGCIIVKCTNAAGYNWRVYHTALGNDRALALQSTDPASVSSTFWNNTSPTSTEFTVSTNSSVNANGNTFVAYLFAHNAGGFGLTGTDNVISCGSYTGTGSVGPSVNLGYEPQWLLIKRATGTSAISGWYLLDNMRGIPLSGGSNYLRAETSDAETNNSYAYATPTATGFNVDPGGVGLTGVNFSGETYIYIAIRRGPMKVPTSGTSVFAPTNVAQASAPYAYSGFPVDMAFRSYTPGGLGTRIMDRLRGASAGTQKELNTTSTAAETDTVSDFSFTYNTGISATSFSSNVFWMLRRAPSFFDEVCYTGTGSLGNTLTHNLGVTPELMIVKCRSNDPTNWTVYTATTGNTAALYLNDSASVYSGDINYWNDTSPTSTQFTVGLYGTVNGSARTYVAYLFATCAGVSKVGSYTGNGTTQTINCGFTGGARFVLIKRTDATGDWYVYDTARGMTVLTDPYLLLNSTAAESATLGSVTTVSTGFAVNASILAAINTNGASYIFLAIA